MGASGFTYQIGNNGELLIKQAQGDQIVTVITVTLNPQTGAYSITHNAPIHHTNGSDENNVVFTLNYSVTDADGDTANGSLTVSVDDDTPTVSDNLAVQLDDDALMGG